MITSDLKAKLSLLDYSKGWLDAGILNEAQLDDQLQEFSIGEDTNKEHYRYRALTAYLKNQSTLSETQIEQIIGLLCKDPDEAMATSALFNILKMQFLSDRQFYLVGAALSAFGKWTEKHIEKQKAIREREYGSH
jgi:hypothetical protein